MKIEELVFQWGLLLERNWVLTLSLRHPNKGLPKKKKKFFFYQYVLYWLHQVLVVAFKKILSCNMWEL